LIHTAFPRLVLPTPASRSPLTSNRRPSHGPATHSSVSAREADDFESSEIFFVALVAAARRVARRGGMTDARACLFEN
jgi:hypothetical protein